MIKNLNRSMVMLITSCMFLFSLSCKKDQSPADPLASAKAWYLKANAKMAFKSNRDATQNIKQEVLWDKAQLSSLDDGTQVVAAPLKIEFANGQEAKGSYLLMISKIDGQYQSQVAYNEEKSNFSGGITSTAVQTAYQNTLNANAGHKRVVAAPAATNRGKVMNKEVAGEVCIDWYLVTTYYNEYGSVLYVTESFLYQTCYDEGDGNGGGGGSGEPQPEEITIDWGQAVSEDAGHTPEMTEIMGIDTFKVSDLSWIYHSGLTYSFISTERGAVKIKNGVRAFYSLTHKSRSKEGSVYYGTVDIPEFTATTHVNSWRAFVQVNYKVHTTVNMAIFNQTYDGPMIPNSCGWNEYFVKD